MKALSLEEIRLAVAGQFAAPLQGPTPPVAAVCTNSKQIEKSSIFLALRGERFDAHQYLAEAAAAGAVAAIVQTAPANAPPNWPMILVADTRIALGQLARFVRRQFRGKVIAVAGSNGKTGTKLLIDACLRPCLKGSISPKSFNNDIGVPLTIFPADPGQDYLVLEMGTNHPGEIEPLSAIGQPDIAVITNCSEEHLEGLGDLAGVRTENARIVKHLNANGALIVNGDDRELLAAVMDYPGKKITFGLSGGNDLVAGDILCDARGTRFSIAGVSSRLFVPLLGSHTAVNALAALAVGRLMGLADDQIIANLSEATGPEMRLQLQEFDGIVVLNDAYNANPASMRAGLETLASLPCRGRRIAILGDMRELGQASPASHEQIGTFIAESCPVDWLICVGPAAAIIAHSAVSAGLDAEAVCHYGDANAATAMAALLRPGDLVLIKGSRAMRLEIVVQAIAGRTLRRAAS